MSKLTCVVSSPVDTYSGYGARSRDFIKALIKNYPDWDIKLLSQRWGITRFGYLNDHNEADLSSRIINKLDSKPNIWFQITVPNEFQPVGDFNVGVTAGIETTASHISWVQGCNRMNLVLASSEHAKLSLVQSKYEIKNKQTNQVEKIEEVDKPVEVLFEGLDTSKYFKVEDSSSNKFNLDNVKESFCFLTIGHWMQGNFGHDRKNIGYTIKSFLETFKNKSNPPALLLKTQIGNSSAVGKEKILEKIDQIRKTVKGTLPNIYLIHGDLTDEEVNLLYNHPKVKVLVSLTKGEGFGRPLLEFTATGKPVIASGWSGHTDFLNSEFTKLIGGTLEQVDHSAAVKDMILKEASWFKPDENDVGKTLKDIFKNYKNYIPLSRKQRRYSLDNFTYDHMVIKLKNILDEYLPEFPEKVEISLPKLNLPKLNKIS